MSNITLISLFLLSLFSSCTAQNKASTEWVETIGYIEGNTSNCYIHYEVAGVKYKTRYASKYGSLDEGEKSSLKYNKINPTEVEILYWKPIFLKEESTIIFSGCIKKIYWFHWKESKYAVRYTYNINGVNIRREQVLPPNYKELYPNLKEGQSYQVECWAENPQRAIIHLDKPIK
jgi:hypothetical protein